ncbi:MAG: TIGR01620 family protein [Magnetococcus sp. MYC-9]
MDAASPWTPPVELPPPLSPAGASPRTLRPVVLPAGEEGPPPHRVAETSTESLHASSTEGRERPVEKMPGQPAANRRLLLAATILLLVLFTGLLLQDAVLFLIQEWQSHPLLGLFFAILLLALGGILSVLVGREWARFRQLRTLTTLRRESLHLMGGQTLGHGQRLVNRITLLYRERPEVAVALWQFQQQVSDYLGDRELLLLFSRHVLATVDDRAYQVVLRHASAAAVMAAVSPMAWLDALFFLWRNLWMVREIAEVYGARPGATGSLLLLRQAAQGIMGAGLADLLASGASHSMGDSLAAMVVAKGGQGIANGLFIARIGLQTMQACRPLPFGPDEMPGLTRIRQELQREIKRNFTGEQHAAP